MTKHEAEVEK